MIRAGDFPESWKVYKIKELGEVVTGTTPPMKQPENYGGSLVWVKPPDLNKGKYIDNSEKKISEIGREKVRVLPAGSVLVSCIGNIGKVAIAGCELCTNQQINSIVPNSDVAESDFLYYLIRRIQPYLKKMASSAVVPLLNKRNFSNVEVSLPSIKSQKHIASILDKAEQLQQWREESAKLTDDYLNSVFLKMFGDPTKNQKEWKIVRLDELCSKDSRITYGIVQPGKEFETGVPIVRSVDLTENFISLENLKRIDPNIESNYPRSRLKGRELLISVRGTLGPVAIASSELENSNVSRGVAIVNPNPRARVEYLLFLFRTAAFQQRIASVSRGIALKQLNLNELRRFRIPLPDLYLQEKFAKIVETVEELKDCQRKSRQQIDDFYNVLMQKAFKGELDCWIQN